jgi:hypothetical protein
LSEQLAVALEITLRIFPIRYVDTSGLPGGLDSGIYGEFITLKEPDSDKVVGANKQLYERSIKRVEGEIWKTLQAVGFRNMAAVEPFVKDGLVSFDSHSLGYVNMKTYSKMQQLNSFPENTTVVVTDNGDYPDGDGGDFRPFIRDGNMILIGTLPEKQKVGEYWVTRNANNPEYRPGIFSKIVERDNGEVEVHQGFNGGPVLYAPYAVVVLRV